MEFKSFQLSWDEGKKSEKHWRVRSSDNQFEFCQIIRKV